MTSPPPRRPRRRLVAGDGQYNPSTTQKMRITLIEDGHTDIVVDACYDAMGELEARIEDLEDDSKRTKDALRSQLTESTVLNKITEVMNARTVKWTNWAIRSAAVGIGGSALTGLGLLVSYAWKEIAK